MAINFETVTGNQTSANVLTQINNNFAKVNLNPVPSADFATNANTVDNKHVSELIPGAATFLDSITSLDDLSVGRYFCTQTGQSWEPVTTTGSRTFLIEVSLDIPNNLKSYKINYIAGEGAGESYYSDYSSGSIKWNRTVTDGNIENLLSIYNYLILNNRKMQPALAQDGFYMVENKKTNAQLITDDGTKYFIISTSSSSDTIIKMYNMDTDELLASQTITQSGTSVTPCYSDNNIIMFYIYNSSRSVYYGYIATFSEDSITIEAQEVFTSEKSITIFNLFKNKLKFNLNDGRYSNDNYIICSVYQKSTYVFSLLYYNKLTKALCKIDLNPYSVGDFTMYPTTWELFVSKNTNVFCGLGEENNGTPDRYRPGGFIYNMDSESLIRLNLGGINNSLDTVSTKQSGTKYRGIVIVGDFVYIAANFTTINKSGIFKFSIVDGSYKGYIPYDMQDSFNLLYKDEKTILCIDTSSSIIFEIDVDSFRRKNYEDNYSLYTLNPTKTRIYDWIPPCALNDRYHKIAVNKAPSEGGVSKIDYYMGYNDYWVAIGGV